ncbi:MAG: hypothetical protein J6B74_01145, partial [Ruminococcus sp.]|nr:hypothetical protein [Ruminococcus sp.]
MNKKIVFSLLFASVCSLSACGKDDIGSLDDSVIINEGSISDSTEQDTSDGNLQTETGGYVVTAVPTTTTTVTTATDELGNIITETVPVEPSVETPAPETPADPQTPETVTETPAQSVIDYTPSTAAAGTPASTAVLPADAPTQYDYNYGPAPTVYNIPGIKYIDNVLIANKSYSLPADFYPDLDQTCLSQFYKLQNDASAV